MPTFTFKGPDGRNYTVDAPEGTTQDQAAEVAYEEFQKRYGGATGAARALNQAWLLDPVEAAGQMVEHIPGIGGAIRRGAEATGIPTWLRQYRAEATANPWQENLRSTGDILNPLLLLLGRGGALAGGVGGALQPVEGAKDDADFWMRKGQQVVPGTIVGHLLGRLAGRVAANRTAEQARRATTLMQRQLEERTTNVNEVIEKLNKARMKRFEKAGDQRQIDRYTQQLAAQAATAARQAVPRATTQQWWREALTPTGDQALAPTTIGPETSGQVRQIIGNRLNAALSQMSFTADPSFGTVLRDATSQTLNAANRDSWEQIFNESVLQPILKSRGSMSGKAYGDYIMDLGARIEELSQRIRSEDMPESRRSDLTKMRNALRNTYNAIEDQAQGTPEVKAALQQARRGYMLWSIGNGATAAERGGEMTPVSIAREWAGRQGDAAYGAEMNPSSPVFHPENARLKTWIESQRQAHQDQPAPVTPQPPLLRPGQWEPRQTPELTLPATPTAASKAGLLPTTARGLAHGGLWHLGGPWTYFAGRPMLEWLAAKPGVREGMSKLIGKGAAAGSRLAGPIAGQSQTQPESEEPTAPIPGL